MTVSPESEPAPTGFRGCEVAITGRLASMNRGEAVARLRGVGARYVALPSETTRYLVVGREGWPLAEDGRLTRSLEIVEELKRDGRAEVSVMAELAFLRMLDESREGEGDLARTVAPNEPRSSELYPLGQLSRMLEVSPDEIRSWVRAGLLSPARTDGRFAFFDFMQVSGARSLVRLLRGGVTIAQVRRSLSQLATWLPDSAAPRAAARLQALERDGDDLVVRLASGAFAEPTGQLRLDFDAGPGASARAAALPSVVLRSQRDWFVAGVRAEDAGDFEAAAKNYHEAMLVEGPRSEIAFNMGNALHSARQWAAAEQRFMQAVEMDPEYVEAWNNLGNVRVEMERHDLAIESYERALDLDPSYADVHFNLAATLEAAGRAVDAERHWRQYLRQCPNGPDVEFVKCRLAAIVGGGSPDSIGI